MATLFYLHGFLSSPHSLKARLLGQFLARQRPDLDYQVPQLPDTPEAWEQVVQRVSAAQTRGPVGVVGSSLGGFWATLAAERLGVRAVVVNPAVRPHELLAHYLGPQHNPYTGAQFQLVPAHMAALAALAPEPLKHTDRLWLLQQQGDEVLDYRRALALYRACHITLEEGGCHAFSGFERHCAPIVRFLQL